MEGKWTLDLGSSHARDRRFYRMLKLYWHTKIFLAHGMLLQEKDKKDIMK